MNFSKMLRLEIWKILYSKTMIPPLLIEIAAIILSQVDAEEAFILKDAVVSSYVGISLTFRYIYMSYIVSKLFSMDIDDKVMDTYIAVGFSKGVIWSVKEMYLIVIGIFNTLFSAFIYFMVSIILNGSVSIIVIKEFWTTIWMTIFPLIIHLVFLTAIDIFSISFAATVLVSVAMIISSGLLPYDISKWVYIIYNNPNLILMSRDKKEIIRMILVCCIELVVFLVANVWVFRKNRR